MPSQKFTHRVGNVENFVDANLPEFGVLFPAAPLPRGLDLVDEDFAQELAIRF